MINSFSSKVPQLSDRKRIDTVQVSLSQAFMSWLVPLFLLVTGTVIIGYLFACKNQQISEARNLIMRLEHESAENAKTLKDQRVTLEKLKDGGNILRQARILGFRQPGSGQAVRNIRIGVTVKEGSSTVVLRSTTVDAQSVKTGVAYLK